MNELYTYNKSKSRMIINTNYKEFQKQTTYIGSGAVLSSTQRSDFIRSVDCNSIPGDNHNVFERGELRDFDLRPFMEESKNLVALFPKETITLYEFRVLNKNKKPVWLISFVTDRKGHVLKGSCKRTKKVLDLLAVVEAIILEEELKSCQR